MSRPVSFALAIFLSIYCIMAVVIGIVIFAIKMFGLVVNRQKHAAPILSADILAPIFEELPEELPEPVAIVSEPLPTPHSPLPPQAKAQQASAVRSRKAKAKKISELIVQEFVDGLAV
jgi:hypothetical protein